MLDLIFPTPKIKITDRDEWLLRLLQIGPFDLTQIQRASEGSTHRFASKHKLAKRLRLLTKTRYVSTKTWDLRIPKTLNYYKTTKKGREQVTAERAKASLFRKVSNTDQRHAYETANVQAATIRHAGLLGLRTLDFKGDRQFLAKVPGDATFKPNKPDSHFLLDTLDGLNEYWDEIDLSTESVGGRVGDTLEAKILFHVARRRALPDEDYVVRMFFKCWGLRVDRFLKLAAKHAENGQHIFLVTTLADYCGDPTPLTSPIFVDHSGRKRRLYKRPKTPRRQQQLPMEEVRETLAEPVLV